MTTKQVRRKKFERKNNPKLPFAFIERDVEILKHIADFYLINTHQLERLTGFPYKSLAGRLQKLWQNHYIQRIYFPGSQNSSMVYALDRNGARHLASSFQMLFPKTTLDRLKEGSFKPVSVDHELMISELHTTLTQAQAKGGFELAFWQQDQRQKDNPLRTRVNFNDIDYPISPDARIELQLSKHPRNPSVHFFLEVDTGTETVEKRFLKKMRGYWLWWNNDGHVEKFNIPGFRVLTVTKTEKRMLNLREVTKRADNKKSGSELFYFTVESWYKDKPEKLLEPIWYTPKDDIPHSIIE